MEKRVEFNLRLLYFKDHISNTQYLLHCKLKGSLHTLLSFLIGEMSAPMPSAVAGTPQAVNVLCTHERQALSSIAAIDMQEM